ncbi:MAG: hypothetical protein UY76_C0028G0003 [Candidatus Uhrbacteria bacterium GW2011_GWA2_52_8d]|uniref:Uncharacterized protein n=1 Tax=Candidatus Uhrbacteria bacterium GW2011_GWA2_52_8d TaxID=1618979 RepID=A0A0G1ZVQ1_9BACT|nr:MAG: hypothetical protein UY76_C0028G0003 [Candidatus Uhrbacteria bacterium GW2011_GWA2_52_8d]
MSHPSRDEYIRRAIKLAQSEARVRRNKKYSDHAREAARAWVGMIELRAMGSIKGYVSAFSKPYQPPHTAVIPAAPKISLSKMGLRVTYLPAGSPFLAHGLHRHVQHVPALSQREGTHDLAYHHADRRRVPHQGGGNAVGKGSCGRTPGVSRPQPRAAVPGRGLCQARPHVHSSLRRGLGTALTSSHPPPTPGGFYFLV